MYSNKKIRCCNTGLMHLLCNLLSHRMFHLQPGIDFYEEMSTVFIYEELNCTSVFVTNLQTYKVKTAMKFLMLLSELKVKQVKKKVN